MVIDDDFFIEKLGTRCLNDNAYRAIYGDGHHLQNRTLNIAGTNIADTMGVEEGYPDSNDYDLPLTELPVDGENTLPSGRTYSRGDLTSADRSPTYSELMNEFKPLAEYIAKRPALRKLWLGLLISTKKILNNSNPLQVKDQLLSMTISTTTLMKENPEGTDLRSQLILFNGKIWTGVENTIDPIKHKMCDCGGKPETKRYKNGNEKPTGKKTECFSGGKTDGHRVNGCTYRKEI